MNNTTYQRQDLQSLSKSDLIELILQLQSDQNDDAPIAPLPAPHPAAPLPVLPVAPLPGAINANSNSADVPAAPPMMTGSKKRYDVEQREKLNILKTYIDERTKVSTVLVVMAFLREIQHTQLKDSKCKLFQIVPDGVIHLCYKYCTDVLKHYFVFMLTDGAERIVPDIHMFSIRDIEPRLANKTPVYKLQPDSSVQAVEKYRPYYTPYVQLSPDVFRSMKGKNSKNIPMSAVFREYGQQPHEPSRFDMVYWKSPYFHGYQLGVQDEQDLMYYGRTLPDMEHSKYLRRTSRLFHVPFSNQLLTFHACNAGNKDQTVSVFDVYNMRWKSNAKNYKYIQLQETKRHQAIMCLYEDRLFLCGGFKGDATNIVETLNCAQITELFRDDDEEEKVHQNQCRLKSISMRSRMAKPRSFGDADVVSVKNQIVVGGGESVEFYDLNKDKWMLHPAQLAMEYYNKSPVIRSFGNVVMMVRGRDAWYGRRDLLGIGHIHCLDIRDRSNKWQLFTDKTFDKIMNFWMGGTWMIVDNVFV